METNGEMCVLPRVSNNLDDVKFKTFRREIRRRTYQCNSHKEDDIGHRRSRPVQTDIIEKGEAYCTYCSKAVGIAFAGTCRDVPAKSNEYQKVVSRKGDIDGPHSETDGTTPTCGHDTRDEAKGGISTPTS